MATVHINERNKVAINKVIENGGMCYPRDLATAELLTAKSVKYTMNDVTYDVSNIQESQLTSRRFYEYSSKYGFVFDLITAICTEHPDWVYDNPELNFYVLSLRRETAEEYGLAGLKGLSGKFWENIGDLNNNPKVFKNIPVRQSDGTLSLVTVQPIIVTAYRDDPYLQTNSKGASITNLKNVTDSRMITRIEIQFFKPLFSGLLEKGNAWIALPKAFTGNIIKVCENHYSDWEMNNKEVRGYPSPETIRKAIMYLNLHEYSGAETELNLKLIDFCLHVLPSELDIAPDFDDPQKGRLYVRSYYRVKEKIELIFYLFNCMHTEQKLKGFKFKTGRVYVDKQKNNIKVMITRDNNTELVYNLEDTTTIENPPF